MQQAQDFEFDPKKPWGWGGESRMIVCAFNSNTGKTETGRWLGSLARQPSLLGEFKVSEKKGRQNPRNFLWSPYAPTHKHLHKYEHKHTLAKKDDEQSARVCVCVLHLLFYFK